MQRRQFLAASLATSALALARDAKAQSSASTAREFYQIRQYKMENGPQTKLTGNYFSQALIPALGKLGFGPIGAFSVNIATLGSRFVLGLGLVRGLQTAKR